jgi:hypothetical protein
MVIPIAAFIAQKVYSHPRASAGPADFRFREESILAVMPALRREPVPRAGVRETKILTTSPQSNNFPRGGEGHFCIHTCISIAAAGGSRMLATTVNKSFSMATKLAWLAAFLFLVPSLASAQTSSSGTIIGTVTDPSRAAVPGAKVTLVNSGTSQSRVTNTDARGGYIFPNIPPGVYSITVSATGFQAMTITGAVVQVAQSITVNVTLQIGSVTQTVQVSAAPTVALETTNSQVGNVLNSTDILELPTLQHNAGELVTIQPGVNTNPSSGAARVTGSVDDQNTITLNGIDITDNADLSNDNGLRTIIPIPADAVEEFRVGVSNEDASYGRGSGAQVALATRRGNNQFHGAVYWYTQNSAVNANTWDNNRLGLKQPHIDDNRFGARFGGPIFKNKTFFFLNYEGRRFPQSLSYTETVPTDTLRAGVVRFADSAGNINSYNLASATACGPAGNQACDPRALGISPTIKQMWSLLPAGNNPSIGDGLNTTGYTGNVKAPVDDDFYLARLDHAFSSKWHFAGMFVYDHSPFYDNAQIDFLTNPPTTTSLNEARGNFISASLEGQLTPTLVNTFRFGYVRDRTGFTRINDTEIATLLGLPGTQTASGPYAVQTGGFGGAGLFIDTPIDDSVSDSRTQSNDNKDIQFIDDLIKIHGSHTIDFGGQYRRLPSFHSRTDQTTGDNSFLTATLDADVSPNITIPSTDRPPTCSAALTAHCITSANVQNWDRMYAMTLGMVDSAGLFAQWSSSLQPLPFGTPARTTDTDYATYFYGMDTWHLRPALTLTYGLSYGWNPAPTEQNGEQSIMTYVSNGQEVTANQYLQARVAAAEQGQIYNPAVGFTPINDTHYSLYNTDWGEVAPRVGIAFNPSFDSGPLGGLFGDRKTVFRGGFAIYYDRVNSIQTQVIPMVGSVLFSQVILANGPKCNSTGPGGANCAAASGNPGLASFRVGQDGTIPVPAANPLPVPFAPAGNTTGFGTTKAVVLDPNYVAARDYNGDFTLQRQLPGGMILEIGWAGKWGRNLPLNDNLEGAPYFMVDSASNQTFAQAYDAVSTALRNGQSVTVQPWFEDMIPRIYGPGHKCPTSTSNTACLASTIGSSFTGGLVNSIFNQIDINRVLGGLPPILSRQMENINLRTYLGQSEYQGFLVTLRKQMSHGLSFDANYTLSRSDDNGVAIQDSTGEFANPYFPNVSWGPSSFDQTHVFNAQFIYNLPAGKGYRAHWAPIDRIIGGWYVSGIFTASSGFPLTVTESTQVWGAGLATGAATAAIPTNRIPTGLNQNVAGSNGIGVTGNPAKRGTGLNLFSDPALAYADFQPVLLSTDKNDGRANPMRGLGFWNLDTALGKSIPIHEQLKASFAFYFFNLFNHPNFNTPSLSLTSPQNFGVVTSTLVPANRAASSRWIEFNARLEF